jgi:hypothetical protein
MRAARNGFRPMGCASFYGDVSVSILNSESFDYRMTTEEEDD